MRDADGLLVMALRSKSGRCPVKYCRRKSGQKNVLCARHNRQEWKRKYPKKALYGATRDKAKQRGIDFRLTFEDFLEAWSGHEMPTPRPREESKGDRLTLDRLDSSKGYELGNLRVVTLSENVIAGNRERYNPMYASQIAEAEAMGPGDELEADDEVPF